MTQLLDVLNARFLSPRSVAQLGHQIGLLDHSGAARGGAVARLDVTAALQNPP